MTDKEHKKEKNRIRKLADKWIKPLGFGWWRIEIEYKRESPPEGGVAYDVIDSENWETIMACSSDANYAKATITVYTPVTKGLSDDDLEEAFLHELGHVLVSPMRSKKKSGEEERVAESFARTISFYQEHMIRKINRLQGKLDKLSKKV